MLSLYYSSPSLLHTLCKIVRLQECTKSSSLRPRHLQPYNVTLPPLTQPYSNSHFE